MALFLSSLLSGTYQGSQGIQGTQGLQGVQGLQGTQGLSNQGVQGIQGTQGLQGVQGLQGTQGLSNQGVQGLQGTQGLSNQGVQGLQGTQGLQGLSNQGVQGLANQGVQGLQGLQGIFGPATIPQNSQALAYTLTSADNGQHILAGAGVTVPAGVFTTGQNVVIYNNTSGTIGITTAVGGVTLRLAGTSQIGNRSLTQRGLATILCVASNEFAISGAGVT